MGGQVLALDQARRISLAKVRAKLADNHSEHGRNLVFNCKMSSKKNQFQSSSFHKTFS